jgi:predicted acetyltransferase
MNDLKLVLPSKDDKESALLMLDEIKAVDAGLPWQYSGLANLEEATSYEDWVKEKANEKNGIDLRDGYVPCTTLFLKRMSDNKVCGSISIRHELNEFLFNFGGHIGYSVTPSERGKGYGKLQLKMALEIAKDLGIEKCLITADETNTLSNKTIISEGGVLENTVMWNNEPLNRYWINLK